MVRLVVVIQKLDIAWGVPFLQMLQSLSILSLEEFLRAFFAFSCVATLPATTQFLVQTVMLPASLLLGPVLVHLGCALTWRREGLQLNVFFRMVGSLALLFFIVLCTAALEPFQCQPHPNGSSTIASGISALCNFTDDHLDLCLIGGILSLLPVGFLTLAFWAILLQFPRRLLAGDQRFVRLFSFLILRFRPSCEGFAVFVMARNLMFAIAPVLPTPGLSLLLIQSLLFLTTIVVAIYKPWRLLSAAYTDMVLCSVFLLVVLQGSFLMKGLPQDLMDATEASMILLSVAMILLLLVLAGVSLALLALHAQRRYKKQFDFFLSHHKRSAGSLARLMKMELRLSGCTVFLDADNLADLTQLLPVLTKQVETLVLLASPSVLMRDLDTLEKHANVFLVCLRVSLFL